jgi:hypothetical protein
MFYGMYPGYGMGGGYGNQYGGMGGYSNPYGGMSYGGGYGGMGGMGGMGFGGMGGYSNPYARPPMSYGGYGNMFGGIGSIYGGSQMQREPASNDPSAVTAPDSMATGSGITPTPVADITPRPYSPFNMPNDSMSSMATTGAISPESQQAAAMDAAMSRQNRFGMMGLGSLLGGGFFGMPQYQQYPSISGASRLT